MLDHKEKPRHEEYRKSSTRELGNRRHTIRHYSPSVLLRLTSFHPKSMTATGLCKFVTGGNVAWIGAISSIFSLVAIAVERYYAVMYPFSNRGNLTKLKLKLCKGDRPGFLDLLSSIQYSHVSHCNLRQQKAVLHMELATGVDAKGLQYGLVVRGCRSSDFHG